MSPRRYALVEFSAVIREGKLAGQISSCHRLVNLDIVVAWGSIVDHKRRESVGAAVFRSVERCFLRLSGEIVDFFLGLGEVDGPDRPVPLFYLLVALAVQLDVGSFEAPAICWVLMRVAGNCIVPGITVFFKMKDRGRRPMKQESR